MRRAMVVSLAAVLLRGEWVFQGVWCVYLSVLGYYLDVPADVTCDDEPRAITHEEEASSYSQVAQANNYVGDR